MAQTNLMFLDLSRRLNALARIKGTEPHWTEASVAAACRTSKGRARVDALVSEYHLMRFVPRSDVIRQSRASAFRRILGLS